jgi:hypothetical protein
MRKLIGLFVLLFLSFNIQAQHNNDPFPDTLEYDMFRVIEFKNDGKVKVLELCHEVGNIDLSYLNGGKNYNMRMRLSAPSAFAPKGELFCTLREFDGNSMVWYCVLNGKFCRAEIDLKKERVLKIQLDKKTRIHFYIKNIKNYECCPSVCE